MRTTLGVSLGTDVFIGTNVLLRPRECQCSASLSSATHRNDKARFCGPFCFCAVCGCIVMNSGARPPAVARPLALAPINPMKSALALVMTKRGINIPRCANRDGCAGFAAFGSGVARDLPRIADVISRASCCSNPARSHTANSFSCPEPLILQRSTHSPLLSCLLWCCSHALVFRTTNSTRQAQAGFRRRQTS